jgi:hypothetical protein
MWNWVYDYWIGKGKTKNKQKQQITAGLKDWWNTPPALVWNSTKCLETQKNNLKGFHNFKYPLSYLSSLPEAQSPVIKGNRTNNCVSGNPIACFHKFPSPIYHPLTPQSLHLIQQGIIKYSSFANILKLRIKTNELCFLPLPQKQGCILSTAHKQG